MLMNLDLCNIISSNDIIAVAVSGGSDSMALLHFMHAKSLIHNFKIIALNVEHGIRGQASLDDSQFVKSYCDSNGIELVSYSVNGPQKALDDKLSLEQACRLLRYECFFDCIVNGKCTKVATAHHRSDNVESVLLNLFRGTGLKGLAGINANFSDKIIRPFLNVSKQEIMDYVNLHSIPFVDDQTNFSDDYTRNCLRLNVIPKIKQVFPEMEKSICRFAEIAKIEDDFLDETAKQSLIVSDECISISTSLHLAILSRAILMALKALGLKKDWKKAHVDNVCSLIGCKNGSRISLPESITVYKEYNVISFYKDNSSISFEKPFSLGNFSVGKTTYNVSKVDKEIDLKSGFYADADKIPNGAVIRFKKQGDIFTKFGGGSKKLNDFLTDKKVPLKLRDSLPCIAYNNTILAVFGLAVSDLIKVDENTKTIIELS